MQTNEPTSQAASAAPSSERTEPEPSVDGEVLDLQYGTGGFFLLDSDDIEALIASRQAWMTPAAATTADGSAPPAEPAPRQAA